MKIETEYAVQMLIEILFEKGLLNQTTYLNVMKEMNRNEQQKLRKDWRNAMYTATKPDRNRPRNVVFYG